MKEGGTIVQIENWQEETSTSAIPGELGIIGQLFQGCIDLYSTLLGKAKEDLSFASKEKMILERNYQILRLWADGHGVLSGQLDAILQRSTDLQQITLVTLNSLSKVIYQRKSSLCVLKSNRINLPLGLITYVLCDQEDEKVSLLRDTRILNLIDESKCVIREAQGDSDGSQSDSDDSEYDDPNDNIQYVTEDIKTYTQCLVDLNNSIECPAIDSQYNDRHTPAILALEGKDAYGYYAGLVRTKFPRANSDLAKCLGKANWERRQRLQDERKANTNAAAQGLPQVRRADGMAPSVFAESTFHDSGLGSSVLARTRYTLTIKSHMSSFVGSNESRIPPLSKEAKEGQPFLCHACGNYVCARTNQEWK